MVGLVAHVALYQRQTFVLDIQLVRTARQPDDFVSGIQRLRVNPADGQVYAVGLSGWQGPAGKEARPARS